MDLDRKETTVVIFTESYPYSDFSERVFLEAELSYLSRVFNRIIIIPFNKRADLKSVPYNRNIELCDFWIENYDRKIKWLRIRYILKAIAKSRLFREKFKKASLTYSLSSVAFSRHLGKWINDREVDLDTTLFYTFWFNETTTALALLSEKWNTKFKIVSRIHSFTETFPRAVYLKKLTASKLDFVYPVSWHTREKLLETVPDIPADKIKVAYLGCPDFRTDKKQKETLTFFTACRIDPEKSVFDMLEFLDALATARMHKIKWIVAGDGVDMPYFRKKVEENKNKYLKIDLLGAIENEMVHRIYSDESVDWAFLLSPDEGLPLALCEALMHGVPVVANNVGGIGEIVNDDTGVLLAEQPEREEFIRGMAPFLDSHVRYLRLSEGARLFWEQNLNSDKLREKFALTLKNLV